MSISAMEPVSNYILLNHGHSSWYKRYTLTSFAGLSTSIILTLKLCTMIYNKEKIIGWKGALLFCSSITGLLTFYIAQQPDRWRGGRGSEVLTSKTIVDDPSFYFAINTLLHNKNENNINQPWQNVSLNELIQVESLASQKYTRALHYAEKGCPGWLSWLIPPRTPCTTKSFTIDSLEYPLVTIDKENLVRSWLRKLIAPNFPERSLALQKKIQSYLTTRMLLLRLQDVSNFDNFDSLGLFTQLPAELRAQIAEYCDANLSITNKEFFVDLLPYITIRYRTRKLVYNYNEPELDINGPLVDLINTFYHVDYTIVRYDKQNRTLYLKAKNMIKHRNKKSPNSFTQEDLKKEFAHALDLDENNIKITDLYAH